MGNAAHGQLFEVDQELAAQIQQTRQDGGGVIELYRSKADPPIRIAIRPLRRPGATDRPKVKSFDRIHVVVFADALAVVVKLLTNRELRVLTRLLEMQPFGTGPIPTTNKAVAEHLGISKGAVSLAMAKLQAYKILVSGQGVEKKEVGLRINHALAWRGGTAGYVNAGPPEAILNSDKKQVYPPCFTREELEALQAQEALRPKPGPVDVERLGRRPRKAADKE